MLEGTKTIFSPSVSQVDVQLFSLITQPWVERGSYFARGLFTFLFADQKQALSRPNSRWKRNFAGFDVLYVSGASDIGI